jgi:hypothetical protein
VLETMREKPLKLKNMEVYRQLFSIPADKARHDRMVVLVEHMLSLYRD